MKIIDLLNKIANGEEVPEHIKIGEDEWYFYKSRNTYGDKKSAWIVWDWYVEENRLNDEVEIIEEEPYVEVCGSWFTKSEYNKLFLEEEKKIPEKLPIWATRREDKEYTNIEYHVLEIARKVDEIIDFLKSKGK